MAASGPSEGRGPTGVRLEFGTDATAAVGVICGGGGGGGIACRRFILAIRLTLLLRSRGSWLLFLQLSTALWISPRFPRKAGLRSASAQPTALHSVS